MIDLKKLSTAEEPTAIDIVHPATGEVLTDEKGNVVRVMVYPPESAEMRAFERKSWDKATKNRKGNRSPSFDEVQAMIVERAVAATAGWENIAYEGKTLECTPENARMVYKQFRWMRNQVIDFVNEESNFFSESQMS